MSADDNSLPDGEVLPPRPTPPQAPAAVPIEDPQFRFWDVVAIALVTLLSIMIFEGIAAGVAVRVLGRRLAEVAHDPLFIVPPEIAAYIVTFAFMSWMLRSRGASLWRGVKWHWPRGWIWYLCFGAVLSLAIQVGESVLPIPKQLPIDKFFSSASAAWIITIFGVTLAPLMEELFFRGFLYPVLARRLGLWLGVFITAFCFALIHEDQLAHAWAPLLLLFIVGSVFTYVRARKQSVAATFLMHAGYNLTIFTVVFFASDHFHNFGKLG